AWGPTCDRYEAALLGKGRGLFPTPRHACGVDVAPHTKRRVYQPGESLEHQFFEPLASPTSIDFIALPTPVAPFFSADPVALGELTRRRPPMSGNLSILAGSLSFRPSHTP